MDKKYLAIIGSIIVAILMITGYFYFLPSENENIDNENITYSFYYDVEIQCSNPVNSTVIVPYPAFYDNYNDWRNILLNQSIVDGQMDLSIVNTEYGRGLKIQSIHNESHGFSKLELSLNIEVPAQMLTMGYEGLGNKVFAEFDNSSCWLCIHIDFHNYWIQNGTKHGYRESAHAHLHSTGWVNSIEWGSTYETLP